MTGEIKPFSDGEEMFMRLAATGDGAGSVSKESVCWWLARAFATIDAERAKVKKLRVACAAIKAHECQICPCPECYAQVKDSLSETT